MVDIGRISLIIRVSRNLDEILIAARICGPTRRLQGKAKEFGLRKILSLLAQLQCRVADGEIKESHLAAFLLNPNRLLGVLSRKVLALLPLDAHNVRVELGKLLFSFNVDGQMAIRWGKDLWVTHYPSIVDIRVIDGRLLAHVADSEGNNFIAEEGKQPLGPYEDICSFDLIGGQMLTGYRHNGKYFVSWNGTEFGPYYKFIGVEIVDNMPAIVMQEAQESVVKLVWGNHVFSCHNYYRRGQIIDGKLFYEAYYTNDKGERSHWIEWGGWRSMVFHQIEDPRIIDGQVFYVGVITSTVGGYCVVRHGDRELARYDWISDATILDGKLLMTFHSKGGPSVTTYDGLVENHNPQDLMKVQLIDGKLFYIAETEDGNEIVIWGGEETIPYTSILSARAHDRQICLVAKMVDGSDKEYIVWGDWTSPKYDEIYNVSTSSPGELSYIARKGRKVYEVTYKPAPDKPDSSGE